MKLDIQKFASSGTIDGWWEPGSGSSGSCDCQIVWTQTKGTSEQNYSTIYAEVQVYKSGSSSTTGTFSGVININGVEYSISRKLNPYHWGNWETIGTASAIVNHNNDGTKTINISTYFTNSGTSMAGSYHTQYPNDITLDTIPRASKPTLNVSSATLGTTSVTITTNRQSSNFTHTIQTKIGNSVIETFTSITTSKTFTPSISNYAPYITGSPSAQLSIVTTTYSGSTQIGSPYTNTMTLVVPDNSTTKPTASIGTLSEGTTGVIPSGWNVYVQGKSKLAYTITGTGKYSATISNYASYISGEVVYSGSSVTSGVLKSAGSNTLTAQVQDSRGFWSATDTETFNVVAYSNPLISEVKAERCLSDGTLADDGTYLKYTFKGSVSPVNNGTSDLNSYGYKIQWKEHSSSTWNDISITNNAYTINKEDIVLSGTTFSYSTTFDIRFAITDSFTTTYSSVITLGTGKDLLNFNASGIAMAIGKVSEAGANEELLEIGMPTKQITDGKYLTSDYDGNYYWQLLTDANEVRFNKQVFSDIGFRTNGGLRVGNGIDTAGSDLRLSTNGSNSNDSGDIVYYYGNGQEKSRIWMDNDLGSMNYLPRYRAYNSSGSEIRSGRLLTNQVLELTTANILQLEPGFYFKEGSTGWTENGWPLNTWHATLLVFGTTAGENGWRTLICFDNSNNELWLRSQQWTSWTSWKKIG